MPLKLVTLSAQTLQKADIDLTRMPWDIGRRLAEENPRRAVWLEVQPGMVAYGDPALVESVLTNMLSNAFKFTLKKEHARVEMGQCCLDGIWYTYVRDNGAGFDMQYEGRLFRPSHRLHHCADFEGSGFGLAKAARIVQRHGGRVKAEGKPGAGATFYFHLPAARE